jgi:hypothetical protein
VQELKKEGPMKKILPIVLAFLIGAGLAPAVISTPVDATVIAPTVTGLLRIRSPNGSEGRPMQLDRKE